LKLYSQLKFLKKQCFELFIEVWLICTVMLVSTMEHSDSGVCVCVCVCDFPGGSDGKKPTCNAGDLGLIPGLGRSPGEGNGNPLQYSHLENSMDGGAWWATVQRSQRVGHGWTTEHTHTYICMHVCVCLSVCIEAP